MIIEIMFLLKCQCAPISRPMLSLGYFYVVKSWTG